MAAPRSTLLLCSFALLVTTGSASAEDDICRIHTDAAAEESGNSYRNAYMPGAEESGAQQAASFIPYLYGHCSNGLGPWTQTNASSAATTLVECTEEATRLKATCFDFLCQNPQSADCTCPKLPPVNTSTTAKKVACVGDSITAGFLSSCGFTYPNQLQGLLGDGYDVTTYAKGGVTMLKDCTASPYSYWNTTEYQAALNSSPDIVVIMLGTNDAKADRFSQCSADYPQDYSALVASFAALSSKPEIYVMVPPPLYRNGVYDFNQTVINSLFPGDGPAGIRTIAKASNLPAPIDLFSLMQAHCPVTAGTPGHLPNNTDVYCDWIGWGGRDGCHPNDAGYGKIAEAVKAAIIA